MNLNQKIKELREYLGLSITEFGRRTGYSHTHIARLENGINIPSLDYIEQLCDVFCLKKEYFDSDEMSVEQAFEADIQDVLEAIEGPKYDGKAPERIKSVREDRGLSQYALAKLAGVDRMLINRVESGESILTKQSAEKIGKALRVGSEWLLYGKDEKKDNPVNDDLIAWLWRRADIREMIWKEYDNTWLAYYTKNLVSSYFSGSHYKTLNIHFASGKNQIS